MSGIATWSVTFIEEDVVVLSSSFVLLGLEGKFLLWAPRPSCEGTPLVFQVVKQNLGRECLVFLQELPKELTTPRSTTDASTAARSFHSIVNLIRRTRYKFRELDMQPFVALSLSSLSAQGI